MTTPKRRIEIVYTTPQSEQTRRAIEGIGQAGERTRRKLEAGTTASSRAANQNARLAESFRNAARGAAVLEGPLGGTAGRLSAMSGALSMMNPLVAGVTVGLAALTAGMTAAVSKTSQWEQSTFKIEALLKTTGGASGRTAGQIEALSQQIGKVAPPQGLAVDGDDVRAEPGERGRPGDKTMLKLLDVKHCENVSELVVRRGTLGEGAETAQESQLLLTVLGYLDPALATGEHAEKAQQQNLIQGIEHLGMLSRVFEIVEMLKKINNLIERLIHCCKPSSHVPDPLCISKGSRGIQTAQFMSRENSPDCPVRQTQADCIWN